jgi:lysozyme family protein
VFENDPQDPGGATKFGVTLNELRSYRNDNTLTAHDVANLTLEDVKPIYFNDFWKKMRCDELPVGVDLIVFDYGVNAGCVRSIKFLQ